MTGRAHACTVPVAGARRLALTAWLLALATCMLALSCGGREKPARPGIDAYVGTPVERTAFDPRERSLPEEPTLLRLDDYSMVASFSDDPEPDGSDPANRSYDFRTGSHGWTFQDATPCASTESGLAWRVAPGRQGVVSPLLDIPFRDLRAIEIRMSASSGRRLRVFWSGTAEPADEDGLPSARERQTPERASDDQRAFRLNFSIGSDIPAGGGMVGYTVGTSRFRGYEGLSLARLRLDPTDGVEGDVTIESIRLLGREGSYAGRGHGIGRENLGNEIRNVLFHRAPSSISWEIDTPPGAVLDIGAGLLDARGGATLTASVESGGRSVEVLRTDITDDTAWHDLRSDLSAWGGRRVTLVLSTGSPMPGKVVLWSNPTISAVAAPAKRPNVIVYLVDTLRADHVGAYGRTPPVSPALDFLATGGVLFEKCTAPAAWTRPSVCSLMTSLSPPSHGVAAVGLGIPDAAVTLAEQMRMAGYVTAGFVTSYQAGVSANLQQGFDFFTEIPVRGGDAHLVREDPMNYFSRSSSSDINDSLFPWLGEHGDKPFFIYLHSMDPHAPYLPSPPYMTPFETGYQGSISGNRTGPESFRTARSLEELQHVRALYDGEIRHNDDRISELLHELDRLGVLDRTLTIVTSDHGEEFRDHGGWEHGQSLHRELIDVPLIMRLPGVLPEGVRIPERVSLLDLMPTVLDVAGLDPNPDVQGMSLLPLIQGEAGASGGAPARERPIFSWKLRLVDGKVLRDEVSVQRGRYKAIADPEGGVTLYDHVTDPTEMHDLASERTELASSMAAEARAWLRSQPRITQAGESTRVRVDEEEQKWLRALGYVAP